ncbi:hypothetical protein J4E83_010741 [Alternaria metachromatica]|uniref:uncharacterized protein n=1 Tax=Alternaria metachromatica TaxID=283354 RepID=UPI0020C51305|nr:uncharacterized protein J4E83_010741 [Alternaria metachromatica]KAI4605198.1 hypothetical protein J4E83_010741 [Alternaria metachromatica]
MHLLSILPFLGLALATPLHPPPPPPPPSHPHPHAPKTNIKCPIIFDGRITKNLTLQSFDTATGGTPYNPDYVKGENRTWSSILLFPKTTPPSRFDNALLHKPVEVTIDDGSLFRAGENLQTGFRRAGLLFKDDFNDAGADASDNGVVTFHWSIRQDEHRPLNLSHEYMNVWHEKGDYSGNQFMFVGGVVLVGDGGTGVDTKKEREMWKVQNAKNEFVYETRIVRGDWQNFGVQLDYVRDTIKVYYSTGDEPLKAVTRATPNSNAGGGQLQIGIAKKPTETETVVYDGYQEHIPLRGEGQIYGGIFVEDSSNGCVSL